MAGLRGKSVGAVGGGGVIEGRKLETDLNQHLHIPRSPPKTSDLNREQLAAPVTMTTSVSIKTVAVGFHMGPVPLIARHCLVGFCFFCCTKDNY